MKNRPKIYGNHYNTGKARYYNDQEGNKMDLVLFDKEISSTAEASLRVRLFVASIIKFVTLNYESKVYLVPNSAGKGIANYITGIKQKNNFFVVPNHNNGVLSAIFELYPLLRKRNFCVIETDYLFNESELADFLFFAKLYPDALGTVAVDTRQLENRKNKVALSDDNSILKITQSKDGYNWSLGGLSYFTSYIFDGMNFALRSNIEEINEYLRILVSKGYKLKAFNVAVNERDP